MLFFCFFFFFFWGGGGSWASGQVVVCSEPSNLVRALRSTYSGSYVVSYKEQAMCL